MAFPKRNTSLPLRIGSNCCLATNKPNCVNKPNTFIQVITVVSVTDADYEPAHKQVEFIILPSPHSYLFRLEQRGQDCDVILTEKLEADVPTNESVATVVYSINVSPDNRFEKMQRN